LLSTTVVPLSSDCREFVSAAKYESMDATFVSLLEAPPLLSEHASMGLEAFKRVSRKRNEVRFNAPVMSSFVVNELQLELMLDDNEWPRRLEAEAADAAVRQFASGLAPTSTDRLVLGVVTAIVQARPSILFDAQRFHSGPTSVNAQIGDEIRRMRQESPIEGTPAVEDDSIYKSMRARNARHLVGVLDLFELGSLKVEKSDVDDPVEETTRLFSKQSIGTDTKHKTSLYFVPFSVGDNSAFSNRIAADTTMRFDTIPLDLNKLRKALNDVLSRSDSATASIVDRSPSRLNKSETVTNPLIVHLTTGNRASAGVVMSRNFQTVDLREVSSGDAPTLQETIDEIRKTNSSHREHVDVSALVWNCERILQAALVLLGAVDGKSPLVIDVVPPAPWILSEDQKTENLQNIDRCESELRQHQSTLESVIHGFFEGMWEEVLRLRTSERRFLDKPDSTFDGGDVYLFLASASEQRPFEFNATGADTSGEGGATADDDKDPSTVTAENATKIEDRPENTKGSTAVPEDERQAFVDDPKKRDGYVARFLEAIKEEDAFANSDSYEYYTKNEAVEAKEALEKKFKTLDVSVAAFNDKTKTLTQKIETAKDTAIEWERNAIQTAKDQNTVGARSFVVEVAMAQALLVQSIGPSKAPMLRVARMDSDDDGAWGAAENLVTASVAGCDACLKNADGPVRWLTLGELAFMFAHEAIRVVRV